MQTSVQHLASLCSLSTLAAVANYSLFTILFTLITACQREPLELYYTGKAQVDIDVDWTTRFTEKPKEITGMTVIIAKLESDSIIYTDITNDIFHYEDLQLEPGNYKMLIFNEYFNGFGSMSFGDRRSFDKVFAAAQQQPRTTDFWDVNVSYMKEPEAIGCAVDTFTVLPEMADGKPRFVYYKDYIPTEFESVTLKEIVDPMTTEMYIRVRVLGIRYMQSVIGSISGMANGFLLTQAWRRPDQGVHLLDNWKMSDITYENGDTLRSVGYVSTTIRTFGLPRGRELDSQRDSTSNILSLCFTLIDGTQHVFRYPVGKMIKYRNVEVESQRADESNDSIKGYFAKTDVTLELDLIVDAPFYEDEEVPNLPYAQPKGTGAFDAEVEDWGDDENIDVPM
jgi:hypothetical protein